MSPTAATPHATLGASHAASQTHAQAFSKTIDALRQKETGLERAVADAQREKEESVADARARAAKILEKAAQEADQEREAILADASYDVARQSDAILNAARKQAAAIANTRSPTLAKTLARKVID